MVQKIAGHCEPRMAAHGTSIGSEPGSYSPHQSRFADLTPPEGE